MLLGIDNISKLISVNNITENRIVNQRKLMQFELLKGDKIIW